MGKNKQQYVKNCEYCKIEMVITYETKRFCSRGCCLKSVRPVKKGSKVSEKHRLAMCKPKSDQGKLNMSIAAKERKKWVGEDNPNYENKVLSRDDVYDRWRKSMKERGLPWTEKECKEHSEKMLGSTNKMRGTKHTDKSKKLMSDTQRNRYVNGLVNFKTGWVSKKEKEIKELLLKWKIEVNTQFHIKGFPYFYDFYIPSLNLILEFNGDYWHANPNKYKSGELIKIRGFGEVLVDDIWKKDERRKIVAEKRGYKTAVLWEKDYLIGGEEELIRCLGINKELVS